MMFHQPTGDAYPRPDDRVDAMIGDRAGGSNVVGEVTWFIWYDGSGWLQSSPGCLPVTGQRLLPIATTAELLQVSRDIDISAATTG